MESVVVTCFSESYLNKTHNLKNRGYGGERYLSNHATVHTDHAT